MTYGIEIKNSDNNVIIDGDHNNFLVRGAGTANFAATAGTGYTPAGDPLDGSTGFIPNSGVGGNGDVLGNEFLFAAPYNSAGFASTAQVHLEGTLSYGANVQRLQRRHGRNEASQGSTPSPKPPQFKWFQIAGCNVDGFTPPSSSSTDYGIEIFNASQEVVFTSAQLSSFGVLKGVLTTSGNSNYTVSGETYSNASTATFIAPTGEDIYDYYVNINAFSYRINPGNVRYVNKAVYQHSTRSITLISNGPKKFLIGKLNQ